MHRWSLPYRALRPLLQKYAAFDRRTKRLLASVSNFADGLVTHGLSAAEQTDLTIGIYNRQKRLGRRELFRWEREWYRASLPPPPARLLLGAAHAGIEVLWLRDQGYLIDAFEPASTALPALSNAVGPSGSALCGSYLDLVRAWRGQPGPLSALVERHYAAIIIGWGSLSHVLDPQERLQLFEACHGLCPHGPILASFWYVHSEPRQLGRAQALGARLGAKLSAWRGLPRREGLQRFVTHAGVKHVFTQPELEALGAPAGREMELELTPYPHATWRALRG